MLPTFIHAIDDDGVRIFLENLYIKKYGLIKKTVLDIMGDAGKGLADDVVHKTYIKMIGYLETLESLDPPALTTYLQCVARSVTINILKKEKRRPQIQLYLDDEQRGEIIHNYENKVPPVEDQVENEMMMQSYLFRLPYQYRDILFLKYYLGMRDKEVADIVGIKRSSIREYVKRARDKLRQVILSEECL